MNIFRKKFQNFLRYGKNLRNYTSQYRTAYSKNEGPSPLWAAFLSGMTLIQGMKHYNNTIVCQEEEKSNNSTQGATSREEKIAGMRKMTTYTIGDPADFEEGKLKEVIIQHEGKEVKLVVTKVDGKLYATSAYCTYDNKTELKDGVIFGDKLYCPVHGCAYCVRTGSVEYGPALDNLAIFYVREKDNKVITTIPKYPPLKVRPLAAFRDYNDMRKVVIIGSGAAAFGCIEGLRQMGYTGEIRMVSKDTHLPYDKTRLSKEFKNVNYDSWKLRPDEYYDDHGIEYLLGREVKIIDNRHAAPHIELEDGLKLEFDALLVATGSLPENRVIPGMENKENVSYLLDIQDHRKIKSYLDKNIKDVTLIGANLISLETAATIRTEYPHINVHIVDENPNLPLDDLLGKEATDVLLDLHRKNGVKFTFSRPVVQLEGNDKEVKEVVLKNGKRIKTDLVLLFPNNKWGNTEFLFDGENVDNIEFDNDGRIRVDYNQRSDHKRIFAAGECSAGRHFLTLHRMPCDNWYTAFHGGQNAAFNILALDIPNAINPFLHTKQYNTFYNYVGWTPDYDEIYIDGDLKKNDFVVYYAVMDHVVAAFGSESRKKDLIVLNEAMRLAHLPLLSEIKLGENIEKIEKSIRETKRSGCFKDLIFEVRDRAKFGDIVWRPRDRSNEYYNFWVHGQQTFKDIERDDD